MTTEPTVAALEDTGRPSRTALLAAAARAAHPLVDAEPLIHVDPLAEALLGDLAEEAVAYHRMQGGHPLLAGARTQVVCRSRFAEDRLRAAAGRGVDQYVVLAAGLDSAGYRLPAELPGLRVHEVDRPPMRSAKLRRLAEAGIAVPVGVHHVAADLATDELLPALVASGFDPHRPAVVGWLGCTMYLDDAALRRTLSALAGLAPGSEVVFDYLVPPDLQDEPGQAYASAVGAVSAEQGEPWRSLLSPPAVAALLTGCGLVPAVDVDQAGALDAELWQDRRDALRPARLQRLAVATTAPDALP